jgi:hypothetical protein
MHELGDFIRASLSDATDASNTPSAPDHRVTHA